MLLIVFLLGAGIINQHFCNGYPSNVEEKTDFESTRDDGVSRKVLGSSVVTSVSVIMDNGAETHFSDAVGKPQSKPPPGTQVASPINLLNPDRYEFYTFNDAGDLVKRLMTLSEIQGIIANADGEAFNHNSHSPEKKVNDIVSNVQSVLKGEMEKKQHTNHMVFDTPDVSSSWSAILPAIFGNSGHEIHPAKPATSMTPETIMLEHQTVPIVKKPEPFTKISERPMIPMITVTIPEDRVAPPGGSEALKGSSTKPSTLKVSKPTSTTRKPLKPLPLLSSTVASVTKKVTVRSTTPTTAIPRITTRGTRPNLRRTTTTTTTTMQPPEDTMERVKQSPDADASTQFIQLFDSSTQKHTSTLSPLTPNAKTTTELTASSPVGALFIIDEKTNTKIPITTKDQLSTLLYQLETSSEHTRTTSVGQNIVEDAIATTTNIQPVATTMKADDKYVLTSSTINEINNELAKTTKKPNTTQTQPPSASPSSKPLEDAVSSTIKEPNLVNSIEQLIQQAVGNIQEVQKTTPGLKTTDFEQLSTTTLLTTEGSEIPTTTQLPIVEQGTLSDDILLSEAMGSLLSQVVSSDFQGLTTLQDLPSTTEILNGPQASGENLEYRVKTTDIFSDSTVKDEELKSTTEPLDSPTFANEILKTDASSYTEPGTQGTDQLESTTELKPEITTNLQDVTTTNGNISEVLEGATPEIATDSSTTEEVSEADLPIVFNLREETTTSQAIDSTTELGSTVVNIQNATERIAPTTEKETPSNAEVTLEKDIQTIVTTVKPTNLNSSESTEATDLTSTLRSDSEGTSTNSYKEAFSESETTDSGSTTLSIEQLLKELTTRDVPKETTVLIITKPVYTTSTMSSTISESTTTSANLTEVTISGNTEAIAADAIASNTDSIEVQNSEAPDQHTESPSTSTSESVNTTESVWTMVSTIAPHSNSTPSKELVEKSTPDTEVEVKLPTSPKPVDLVPMPQLSGLEETTKHLDHDIYQFVGLCNELAFGFWKSVTSGISSARSVVLSPFAATSLLAMVFLGARGATSGEMNEILRLDDMVTFNPHLIFKNVSESIEVDPKQGVATSVILRELYSDRGKGHLLNFYKERAKAFYDGHVEEVNFKEIGDVIRRRTNLIIKKLTGGKIQEYIKDGSITVKRPLAGVSASIFQTDCSQASVEGRDGELYFVVLPSIRQRRLVPVPAAVWRDNFLAGYDPALDATAVSIGNKEQIISTIFVIPGQQGIAAPGDGLARLERHLIGAAFKERAWSRLLQTLIPRPGLEVQIPRFQHRSVINATVALQQMGMKDLFDAAKADLRGLNGVANDLYLSDILQVNNFATCGEAVIGETHHSEIYPATANRTYRRSRTFKDLLQQEEASAYESELLEEPRDYQRAFHDPLHDPSLYDLPLPLRPRQARLPDPPRLRFDRPFLYFVRHNPTGLILHMGRFNPRLLP